MKKNLSFVKSGLSMMLLAAMLLTAACTNDPGNDIGGEKNEWGDVTMNSFENSIYQLTGVDRLGRVITPVASEHDGKFLGCFYWMWAGEHPGKKNFDISKIIASNPDDLWSNKNNKNSEMNAFHWWTEPLFGYYHAQDEWVMRKHLEMLTIAGVDFIAVDLSNGVVYKEPIKKMMALIEEYRSQGIDCPQITFFTHVGAKTVVEKLYKYFYADNYCPNSWWRPYDNKPFIIAYQNPDEWNTKMGNGITEGRYSEEIESFFHFRKPQWPDEEFDAEAFPWIDWGRYEQKDHDGVISVSPASGPGVPMSHAVLWKDVFYQKMMGRGWDGEKNVAENIEKGSFYQLQWDYAKENDPEIVFLDGWNEWIAVKNPLNDNEIYFADAFNEEFSRDIEPMKGGYGDNFYIQTIINSRDYKGKAGVSAFGTAKVDFGAGWENVKAVYKRVAPSSGERDFKSAWGGEVYKTPAANNIVKQVSVAHDDENIWLRIETEEAITERFGDTWMNVMIGTGTPSQKGWNGFEYIINRKNTGSIEKLNADFTGENIGNCEVSIISGNVMVAKISRSMISLTSDNFVMYFKVADSVGGSDDVMNYYADGESFPIGRLGYEYRGVK